MDNLDRGLQRTILQTLSQHYPKSIDISSFETLKEVAESEHRLAANLVYLEEHKLISSGLQPTSDESFYFDHKEIKITAKGLDLLADDGGTSSILTAKNLA